MNEDKHALKDLLSTFHVGALGQGDTTMGIKTLASMAGVLANLAPDDFENYRLRVIAQCG